MSEPRFLTPAEVQTQLDALKLSADYRGQLEQLLALAWEAEPPRILVAAIHAALYSDKTLDTANRNLSRLVAQTNDKAKEHQVELKAMRTQAKRGGAVSRYLWFEHCVWARSGVAKTRADMQETNAVPPGARVDGQRALPLNPDEADRSAAAQAETADDQAAEGPRRPPESAAGSDLQTFVYACNRRLIRQLGTHVGMDKDGEPLRRRREPAEQNAVVALDYLTQWLDDPDAPSLFALLGEYGMGKTITCQALKERLDSREAPGDGPFALYFDLRLITGLDRRTPTLREVCAECMERGWQGEAAKGVFGLDDVLRWAADGALVIFDGLDEVLVKLDAAEGQTFTRSLLSLPALVRDAHPGQALQPRLLISCRTHFFRTLRDQQNHFTGQERGGPRPDAFRALVLLPFTEGQIQHYLRAALHEDDAGVERLLETIRSVHNLSELSQRPYTLGLIADQLPEIERLRLDGRTVYGTSLYRRMVQRWLERDSGKHHIQKEHKLRLAAHLAAHLWREGSGLLPASRIEPWFFAWLDGEPDLRLRYQRLHPEQLEEDLRTATFLVREDGADGSAFRFAHTSLLEYFLAEYLLDAIRSDTPERWDLPRPSPETLDFLGQLLAETDGERLVQTLGGWRLSYRRRTSELLLDYALRALDHGWPAPSLRGIVLTGVDLSDRVFRVSAGGPRLDLGEADFSGGVLRRVIFDGVCLRGARFCEAELTQASMLNCDAGRSDWTGARCDGAVWRRVDLTDATWTGVRGQRAELIHTDGDSPGLAESGLRRLPACEPSADGKRPNLGLLAGHAGPIHACAYSPDGTRLLSVGKDGTLRMWDASSGVQLLRCEGHKGKVNTCAFSPDSTRFLSGGSDGTVRVWRATSGVELLCCQGHDDEVSACALSFDGERIISGGHDGTLRIWSATNGSALLRLKAHPGVVDSCAFSRDGSRILSAGDFRMHIWDATTGEMLLCLSPKCYVWACAFSPDGKRILSGSSDGKLRLWDTASGAVLLACNAVDSNFAQDCFHMAGITACGFTDDGLRLLSVGSDGNFDHWDAKSGKHLLRHRYGSFPSGACSFSQDGKRLFSEQESDDGLRLQNAESRATLVVCEPHHGEIAACAYSAEGRHITCVDRNSAVSIWDVPTGTRVYHETRSSVRGSVYAISPDGSQIVIGDREGYLHLWNSEGSKELLCWRAHRKRVSTCAFSPDGMRILSGGLYDNLRIWDLAKGDEVQFCEGKKHWFSGTAFSPEGARVMGVSHDGLVRLWDSTTGKMLLRCDGHRARVQACAFSPDGRFLLSGGDDGTIRLWNWKSGEAIFYCKSHRGAVLACAFNGNGSRIASGGDDGMLRLWDTANGVQLLCCVGHIGGWNTHGFTPDGRGAGITNCCFSPDGTQLLSGGTDGTLRLWDATTGELLRIHAIQNAPWPGHAVWEPHRNRVISWSGNAWRWLRWLATDANGQPDPLPLETYADLPPADDA